MFPSLEVATEDFGSLIGACMSGYSCAYMNTLSWQTPTKPLPMEINPRVVFERMFGWESHQGPAAGAAAHRPERARRRHRGSVRARGADSAAAIARRLDEYLEHVRGNRAPNRAAEQQHESRVGDSQRTGRRAGVVRRPRVADVRPAGARLRDGSDACVHLHVVPRVQRADLPQPRRHRAAPHRLAHTGQGRADRRAQPRSTRITCSCFARFLQRLQSTPDGDGSLLDHSTIVYGSGMGDGNIHAPSPLPMAVVGGGRNRVTRGRHVVAPDKTPLPNLLRRRRGAARNRAGQLRHQHGKDRSVENGTTRLPFLRVACWRHLAQPICAPRRPTPRG